MTYEGPDRIPLNGCFELTARCNLSCNMCMIRIDNKKMAELGGRERTTKEWIDMASEVADAGTLTLLLTGGEPMLRQDFSKIYREIAKMGFVLTLYTNATLVTPEIMKALSEFPPHTIGITTYGASPETYKKVTGCAEAYNRMIEAVEKIKYLPSKLIFRTTLIKDNIQDLDKMTEWAFSYGKDVPFDVSRIVTKPVRGGISDVESCRLTPEDSVAMIRKREVDHIIKPFLSYVESHAKEDLENGTFNHNNIEDYQPSFEIDKEEVNKPSLYGCDAGMTSYSISWDGKLTGCQMLEDCWTYPFEYGFNKAWDDFPNHVKHIYIPKECSGCDIPCNACPATRLAETGSLSGLPDYICKESKLVYKMKARLIKDIEKIIEREASSYV